MKSIALLVFFAGMLLNAQTLKSASLVSRKQTPRIFVAELHFPAHPDWDAIVRSKLIASLVQNCGSDCTVVEAVGPSEDDGQDGADEILTGAILVQAKDQRHFKVHGAMR